MKKLLFLFLIPLASLGQNLYYPPNSGTWETKDPSELGYCQEKIDSMYDFLASNNSKAFLLLKDGKIVLEKYFGTFTKDSLWYWASAGKTLTAFITGIAQEEGYLSLSDTSSKYLGKGWTTLPSAKEDLITVWHQLTMTSGLDDGTGDPDCTYDTCLVYKADAGNRWAYHNAPYTLLDSVIYHATGQSINAYFTPRLRNPIGMNGAYIKLGFNNVYFSNARSFARFGLLLMGNGIWDNDTLLADSSFLWQMRNSSQTLNYSYGYLTWLNGKQSFMLPQSQLVIPGSINPDAPADMYAAMGKNGQVLNIVPSENLIWLRMGDPPGGTGGLIGPVFNNDVWKYINELNCEATGIADSQETPVIKIWPNPASSEINIDLGTKVEKVQLQMTDTKGSIVFNRHYDHSSQINTQINLDPGLYFIQLTAEQRTYNSKILIN